MAVNLDALQNVDGFIGAAVVDSESGMCLGTLGGGPSLDLEVAAAGNCEVVRAKRKTMASLQLKDRIEDILITLGKYYHLIRPLETNDGVFIYLALNRNQANLAMARVTLREYEKSVDLAA
ncbi:hypothetical protein TDB9533_04567 [Thalassocella blandensis]|nr:hypothetical protein TDB9533_04567 [Thalassocella blandensis]